MDSNLPIQFLRCCRFFFRFVWGNHPFFCDFGSSAALWGAFREEIYLPRWRRISSLHQKYKLVARIGTGAGKEGGWDPKCWSWYPKWPESRRQRRFLGVGVALDGLRNIQFPRNELQVGYVFSDKTGGRCWRSVAPTSLILRHCHGMSGWKCSAIFISCNPYLCKFASNLQWQ
jgi:hypothetical protein